MITTLMYKLVESIRIPSLAYFIFLMTVSESKAQTFVWSEGETCYDQVEGPDHFPSVSQLTNDQISVCATATITVCARGDFNGDNELIYVKGIGNDDFVNSINSGVGSIGDVIGIIDIPGTECRCEPDCTEYTFDPCVWNQVTEDGEVEFGLFTNGASSPNGNQVDQVDLYCTIRQNNSSQVFSACRNGGPSSGSQYCCDGNCFQITDLSWSYETLTTTIGGSAGYACGDGEVTFELNNSPCTNGQMEFSGTYSVVDGEGNNVSYTDNGDNTVTVNIDNLGEGSYTVNFTPAENDEGNPSCLTPATKDFEITGCCSFDVDCPIDPFTSNARCNDPIAELTLDNLDDLGIVINSSCGNVTIDFNDPDYCNQGTFTRIITLTDGVTGETEVCEVDYNIQYELTPNCPENEGISGCALPSMINNAFIGWKGGFGYGATCDVTTTDLDNFTLPSDCSTSDQIVTINFEIEDECGNEVSCSSSFTVYGVEPIELMCPQEETTMISGCLTQDQIEEQYDTWKDEFSFSGGCNAEMVSRPLAESFAGNFVDYNYMCGYGHPYIPSLTYTFEVEDCYGTYECTRIFTITKVEQIDLECAGDVYLDDPCNAEVTEVYADWYNNFIVNNGCEPITTNLSDLPTPDNFSYDCSIGLSIVDFTFAATETCSGDERECQVTSSFIVEPINGLQISCPDSESYILDACASQGDINDAFDEWKESFYVSGGCNTSSNIADLDDLEPPTTCPLSAGTVSFTLMAFSDCGDEELECSSTFSVPVSSNPTVSCPEVSIQNSVSGCSSEEAIDEAFDAWISEFNASGGCGIVSVTDLSLYSAPSGCLDSDQSITIDFSAMDECGKSSSCSATFTVQRITTLTGVCPVAAGTIDYGISGCANYESINSAFNAWKNSFSYSGGCGEVTTNLDDYSAPERCNNEDQTVTINLVANDDCGSSEPCEASFTVYAAPLLYGYCPDAASVEYGISGCSTQEEINNAFDEWKDGFSYSGGCGEVTTNLDDYFAPEGCNNEDLTVTINFVATDDCGNSEPCEASFTIYAIPNIHVSCTYQNAPLSGCSSQEEINDAFSDWIEGFTYSGGCDGISATDLSHYEAPLRCSDSDQSISIEFLVSDDCGNSNNCSTRFVLLAAPQVSVNCPDETVPNSISACNSQEDIDAAVTNWLNSFGVSNEGCGILSSTPLNLSTELLACAENDQIANFTFEASDGCTSDNCTASFTVFGAGPQLEISCGESSVLLACVSEEIIERNYNDWYNGFSVNGGCNTISNLEQDFPQLPDYMCGNGLSLEFTLEVSDNCTGEMSCETSFFIVSPDPLNIGCPEEVVLSSCSSQVEIQEAYDNWVQGFTISGGCNTISNMQTIPPLPDYECGSPFTLDFNHFALDVCLSESTNCTSSFSIEGLSPLTIDCGNDVSLSACATDAEIVDAFLSWVDGFSYTGGCNVVEDIQNLRVENLDLDCLENIDIDFEYRVYDDCNPDGIACQSNFFVDREIVFEFLDIIPTTEFYQCFADVPVANNLIVMNNCGVMTEVPAQDEVLNRNINCPNSMTIYRTWYYADECGRDVSTTQTIFVQDTQSPITPQAPADLFLSCDDDTEEILREITLIATDNCSGEIIGIMNENRIPSICPYNYVMQRIWTFTDECGNQSSVTQNVTFSDNEGPQIPRYESVVLTSCAPDNSVSEPLIAFDNCSGEVEGTYEEVFIPGVCLYDYQLYRNWSFVDDCGNETNYTQEYSFSDTEPPIPQVEPQDLDLSCMQDIPDAYEIVAVDGCYGEMSVAPVDHIVSEMCTGNYIMDRVWTFEDGCSNVMNVTQRISVFDEELPYLENVPPDLVLTCRDEIPAAPTVLVMDNCNPTDRVEADMIQSIIYDAADCGSNYTLTRTWRSTDECNNVATGSQRIRVEDRTAPELIGDLPNDIVVDCDIPNFDLEFRDECGSDNIIVTKNEERFDDPECEYNHILVRTYSATDCAGNSVSGSYRITVVDNTAPTMEFNHPLLNGLDNYGLVEVNCERNSDGTYSLPVFNPSSVTVTDNCSTTLSEVRLTDNQIASGTCYIDEYIALFECVFEAADDCGNVAQRGFYLKIVDNQKPQFSEYPVSEIYTTCDNVPQAELIEATDQCSSLEVFVDDERYYGTSECVYDDYIMRTWTAVDECGNTNTTTQKINLEASPPKILDYGPSYLDFDQPICRDNLDDLYIIGGSDCGLKVNYEYEEETIEIFCEDVELIRRNYYLEDECGNTAVEYFDIYVYRDEQYNPSFAITNPMLDQFMDIENFGLNSEITIRCSEIQNNEINRNSLALASGCEDFYYISFDAIDNFGLNCDAGFASYTDYKWYLSSACNSNISEFSFRVNYIDDVPPQIELTADQIEVFCDEGMPEVKVSDDCSTVEVQILEEYRASDCILENILDRTIIATDMCGNVSEKKQVVVVSPRPPVFNIEEFACSNINEQVQATARFECEDLTLNAELIDTDLVRQCDSGTSEYNRLFRVMSPCGEAYDFVQTVYTDDITPPVFVETAYEEFINLGVVTISESDASLYFILNELLEGSAVTAVDDCGQSLEVEANMSYFDLDCGTDGAEGQYNFKWNVSDHCGNQASKELTIRVIDYIPPIATNPPSDITIYCGNEIPEVNLNVQESGYYFEDYSEEYEGDKLIRTWNLNDFCGNSSVYRQVVTFADGNISASLTAPQEILCNTNVNLSSSVEGGTGPYEYSWSIASGDYSLFGSSSGSSVNVVVGFGHAEIKLEVKDGNGCFTSETISLSCKFDHDIGDDQGINVTDDDLFIAKESEKLQMGTKKFVEQSEDFQSNIYPNPAFGLVQISATNDISKIEVISPNGNLLKSFGELNGKEISLDLENIKAGVYYVKIYSGLKVAIEKLFIVY